jgi:hypothetical protein
MQRIQINLFDRNGMAVIAIQLPTPLGVADMNPVGGAIARS